MSLHKLIILLFLTFILSGCAHTLWIHKNFDAIKSRIDTISIVFPQVEYSVMNGKVKKTKFGYSMFISKNVADVLKDVINEGDFLPKSATITYDSTIINQSLPRYFSNPTMKYEQMRDSLQTSQGEERIFPLTPELQVLVDSVHTKYFIYVTGIAFGTTENLKRYDIVQEETFKLLYDRPFVYEYQWDGLQLLLCLVETKSKEVLWYNYNEAKHSKYNPLLKEDIKNLCLKLLNTK